jgi:hypothetical protein
MSSRSFGGLIDVEPADPSPTRPTSPAPFGADLDAVDQLCRMQLAARRLGCRIVLADVDERLRDLITFLGIADVLLGAEPVSAPEGLGETQPNDRA